MSVQSQPAVRGEATATADTIPMRAQVYVRLRHRLREIEDLLDLSRAERLDEDGQPRQVTERAVLESQAASLRAIAEAAEVVPVGSQVIIGSTVHVRPDDRETLEQYEIVLPTEADPAARKVSFDSPFGAALLRREVGDVAVVSTPRGDRRLHVMVVVHEDSSVRG